jgi:hypothetical protein
MIGAMRGAANVDSTNHQQTAKCHTAENGCHEEHGAGCDVGAYISHQQGGKHAAERFESNIAAEALGEFSSFAL